MAWIQTQFLKITNPTLLKRPSCPTITNTFAVVTHVTSAMTLDEYKP